MYIARGLGHTAPKGQRFDVNRNVLTLRSSVASFKSQTTIVSEKSIVLPFSHTEVRDQIWLCLKIGQGQPSVIIWAHLVVLEHSMMHTKIQGYRTFDSREEDCFRFIPYMSMTAILVNGHGNSWLGRKSTNQINKSRQCFVCIEDEIWSGWFWWQHFIRTETT